MRNIQLLFGTQNSSNSLCIRFYLKRHDYYIKILEIAPRDRYSVILFKFVAKHSIMGLLLRSKFFKASSLLNFTWKETKKDQCTE